MTKTGAERQADFRRKQVQKIEGLEADLVNHAFRINRLEMALQEVIDLTGEKQGEAAVAIRTVCVEALG